MKCVYMTICVCVHAHVRACMCVRVFDREYLKQCFFSRNTNWKSLDSGTCIQLLNNVAN